MRFEIDIQQGLQNFGFDRPVRRFMRTGHSDQHQVSVSTSSSTSINKRNRNGRTSWADFRITTDCFHTSVLLHTIWREYIFNFKL